MNTLVATLGMSWKIIPELFGFTNPGDYDFFHGNEEVEELRKQHAIKPVSEIRVITPDGNDEAIDSLNKWARAVKAAVTYIVCKDVKDLASDREILLMRSCIYATVFDTLKRKNGDVYISLAGGRKTMSADMQDAAYLFGHKALLHIIDRLPINDKNLKDAFNNDALIRTQAKYAKYFLPVIINEDRREDPIVYGKKFKNFSMTFINGKYDFSIQEDGTGDFVKELKEIRRDSSQLYDNFSNQALKHIENKRSSFRKLYFLHPEDIRRLQKKKIEQDEADLQLLQKLPKADLHTHLGGVLNPAEIIQTALSEKEIADTAVSNRIRQLIVANDIESLKNAAEEIFELKKDNFALFYPQMIAFITAFEDTIPLFHKLIYGDYDKTGFYGIGLENYQKLGDYQGSSLLQTKKTIQKAVELYIQHLKSDNVRYVEIRCSPYKYTKYGLSACEVLDTVMQTIKSADPELEYRLIMIVGRDGTKEEIKQTVTDIMELYNNDIYPQFKNKIAAIDLAGTESKKLPESLREIFLDLLRNCISITIHAGETESVESIWQAVYCLSADRIGHGLTLGDNGELLKRFLDKNIGIEMCPSSNDQVVGFSKKKGQPYPLKKYLEAGLKVCVNTDDCGISLTTLSQEFRKAALLSDSLSVWDCIVLIRNGISMAFVDKKTKAALMKDFEEKIYTLIIEGKII